MKVTVRSNHARCRLCSHRNRSFQVPPKSLLTQSRAESACAIRIRLMWESMREAVISAFPPARDCRMTSRPTSPTSMTVMSKMPIIRLSIEGYRVTEELIAKIAFGNGTRKLIAKTEMIATHWQQRYHQAFLRFVQRIAILKRAEPGDVVRHDHHDWLPETFRAFGHERHPEAKHLAGYRSWPVFIRYADMCRHPMSLCAKPCRYFRPNFEEPDPAVRAVLGHFVLSIFILMGMEMDAWHGS